MPRHVALVRPLVAVPFLLVLVAWTVVAAGCGVVAWLVASVSGRVPLRRVLAGYVGVAGRTLAFAALVSRRFRGGEPPVSSEEPQPRWTIALRPALALPGVVLGSAFLVVLGLVAVASWATAIVLGRVPEGLRELGAYCVRYVGDALAYLLLVRARRAALTVG